MPDFLFNKLVQTFPVKLDDLSVPFVKGVNLIGIEFEDLLDGVVVVGGVSY